MATAIAEDRTTYVSQVVQRVQEQHGEVPQQILLEAVRHVVQAGRVMTFGGQPEQSDRPRDLVYGTSAMLYHIRPEDVVITPAEASTRGWVTTPPDRFRLSGRDGAAILLPLLRQIGRLYARARAPASRIWIWSIWRSSVVAAYGQALKVCPRRQ